MKVLIEIRPGEGGEDAKQLVKRQAGIYENYAQRQGLVAVVSDSGRGYL